MKVTVVTTVTNELLIGTREGKYEVRAHQTSLTLAPDEGLIGGGAPLDLPHLLVVEAAAEGCARAENYLRTLAIVEEEEKGR